MFWLLSISLPPLLVFGLYHLLSWLNLFHINERIFWRRVALTSAVSHLLLLTGFIVFTWLHFRSIVHPDPAQADFGSFVFTRSEFWRMMLIFDVAPALIIVGMSVLLAGMDVNPPGLLVMTFAITYVVGTVQWYYVGGAIGSLLERFFEGLKTPEEEDEWM
jgi:hypothetical protein